VEDFVDRLASTIQQDALLRARDQLLSALNGHSIPRRRGRPPKSALAAPLGTAGLVAPRRVRRRPKQLCPVPGCRNPAAPVFGMVCAEHRAVPKDKIAKYREERRAAKHPKATVKEAVKEPARDSARELAKDSAK
jgi:hypothetical protein